MKISQCMIVKNEEDNIERALSWGKGIFDEQIVVDTGSTDRTLEIAKKMGAKIYSFPWIDDFSAAKNFAIEKASGRWIAFLDADEYMNPESVENLKKVFCNLGRLKNIENQPDILRCNLVSLNDKGVPIHCIKHNRFFRNREDLRYKNKIHEVLYLTKTAGIKLCSVDLGDEIEILHTGYTESAVEKRGKIERNVSLLKEAVSENPDSLEMQVYLGEALIVNGEMEEADKLFRRLVTHSEKELSTAFGTLVFYHLLCYRALHFEVQEKEMVKFYQKATEFEPDFPDFDYLLGLWYMKIEDWSNVYKYFEQALSKKEKYSGSAPTHIDGELKAIYQALTVASFNLKQKVAAVRYGVLCLRIDKYTLDVLQILLYLLRGEAGEMEKATGTMGILDNIYSFSVRRDRLLVAKCAQSVEFYRVYENVKEFMAEEEIKLLE